LAGDSAKFAELSIMSRKRNAQASLYDVGNYFSLELDPNSFYGQLAVRGPAMFKSEDFDGFYKKSGRGRPCVPPTQLALLTLIQNYVEASDQEIVDRAMYDLRICAVLRKPAGERFCAKSTLQLFRAQLVVHEMLQWLISKSLREARDCGFLTNTDLIAVLDTKPIVGKGAVKDTINLIADAMMLLARVIAEKSDCTFKDYLSAHNLERLWAPSIKGTVDIDWNDAVAQKGFLTDLVADARRLLALADASDGMIRAAASLLEQIMLQDIEEIPKAGSSTQAQIKKGTAPDRIPSVTDSEQRHGRKSASKRFVGSKAAVCTDAQTGLIMSTCVLPGNAGDALSSLDLVGQAEMNAQAQINTVLGDCAYGGAETRQDFQAKEKELVAKVPKESQTGYFPKSAFEIALPPEGKALAETVITCPAGHTSKRISPVAGGGVIFHFGTQCRECPLRTQCTASKQGRSIRINPQERVICAARNYQCTPEGRALLRKRLIVENSLARVGNLGIGMARYIGRKKTEFQLAMAATVANLRLTWNSAMPI
jgi:hypothetical protein